MDEQTTANDRCPWCGGELLDGKIRARNMLRWTGEGLEVYLKEKNLLVLFDAPAQYCPQCKKVMADTEE